MSGDFKRARKNSVDLFADSLHRTVISLRCHENERSFELSLSEKKTFVFKLFGRQTNILFYKANEDNNPLVFKTKLISDQYLELKHFDRPLVQSKESLSQAEGDLQKVFPTFGPLIRHYLTTHQSWTSSIDDQWELIQSVLKEIQAGPIYLIRFKGRLHLSLVNLGECLHKFDDVITAGNQFYGQWLRENAIEKERRGLVKKLEQKITKSGNYILKSKSRLHRLTDFRYNQIADILMANLHSIPPGTKEVELFDFYQNKPLKIQLNPNLSGQKNAEKLYRKSKNQVLEIKKIEENIQSKQEELDRAESQLQEVRVTDDFKWLRSLNTQATQDIQIEKLPYHERVIHGYTLMIGKNAKANDELTTRFTHKNDLWFHARDVPGSHVVLKHRPGQNFPANIIEAAAQVAAWFSRNRTIGSCPVIYTERKYVRKSKGLPAGAVRIDREKVIVVEPKDIGNDNI